MGFLARMEASDPLQEHDNTKRWWWNPPLSEAEQLALDYVTLSRKHAERIIAFAQKYPTELHLVKEMLIEAEFAADDFGRRMAEQEATLDQMEREKQRQLRPQAGGLGIE